MKRFLACLVVMLALASCIVSYAEEAIDYDQMLVDVLIKVTTAEFYEPSAVRVLEIGNFSKYEYPEDEDCSPWNVMVRLQGENRVGGTLNHYYWLCIKGGEATSQKAKDAMEIEESIISLSAQLGQSLSWVDYMTIQTYRAETGDCVEIDIEGSYSSWEPAEEFSIKNVNTALKAYWEDLGF